MLWMPLTVVLCLPALRMIKGVLINAAIRNKAAEGRWTDRMTSTRQRRSARAFPGCSVAGAWRLIVLLGLGTWQVQRLAWKEALIATIAERIAMPPVRWTRSNEASDIDRRRQEYRPVLVSARFLHDHEWERHFFATHKGATGYFVYTPLKLRSTATMSRQSRLRALTIEGPRDAPKAR
jgi:hypothetical protein